MAAERTRLLTLADREQWRSLIGGLPDGDEPFFQPGFYAAAELQAAGRAECYVYEADGETVAYPYLRRSLNALPFLPPDTPWSDAAGGYGYNGALSTSEDPAFLTGFRRAFHRHCEERHILTEFLRFHPLLKNARMFASDCTVSVQNQNIAVDLRPPLEDIRASYDHSCRKNIKKAEREGVRVFIEEGKGPAFDDFLRIYRKTMSRVDAGKDYDFGRPYFEELLSSLDPKPVIAYAEHGGRIVSCELALRSRRILYSTLGGTDDAAFPVRPNNALKDALVAWARGAGCAWYFLGGGVRPGDGIFNYKRTFAPDGAVDFEIGYRVHAPAAYQEVVGLWMKQAGPERSASARVQRYWE